RGSGGFRGGGERLGKAIGFVVNAGVEAEGLDDVGAFGLAAGDADDVAAEDLSDLAYGRPHRSAGAGDHEGLTRLGLADPGEPRPRRQAGHAEHTEGPRGLSRRLAEVDGPAALRQRVVLPATGADDPVALAVARELRADDLRDGAAHHDF